MFYESLHYFRGQKIDKHGPTSDYLPTSLAEKGGFPAYKDWDDPMGSACQKSFIVAINDAYPWVDKRLPGTYFGCPANQGPESTDCGSPTGADTHFDVRTWTNSIGSQEGIGNIGDQLAWHGSGRGNSNYVAGLAYQANTQDLRSDLTDAQTISTFMIDVQEYNANPPVTSQNPLWLTGKYGGFKDSNGNGQPDQTSEWDSDGDGEPDNYVLANAPDKMVKALRASFLDIQKRTASAAAVSTNSTRLDVNTAIYQARFNSVDWSGQVLAFAINSDGTIGNQLWNTDTTIPAAANRHIFTWNGSNGIVLDTAHWNDLSTAQQDSLKDGGTDTDGQARLNWIRGDQSNEKPTGSFRRRVKILGDIVNSTPIYVTATSFGYESLPVGTPGRDSYAAFYGTNLSRRKMLYVGANDAMVHALDAVTGVEKFAFLPHSLFPNLASLSNPSYSHKYFIDGSPQYGHAYFSGAWHTILVGSPGAGSKSIFALDITDPDNFDQTKVLWEFADSDLGYPIGQFVQPVVGRMQDGTWAVVFGNGYESTNQHAILYVVNVQDGTLIKKIDTETSGANGLAGPVLLADASRTIKYAYAGDLQGNLWKFDLSSTSPSNWSVAFDDGGTPATPKPLFQARRYVSSTNQPRQPITGPPDIAAHPSGGYMIIFGTGQYFETDDNTDLSVQSLYGVWDKDDGNTTCVSVTDSCIYPTDRTILQSQTILTEVSSNGNNWRVVSDNAVDWNTQRGWYMDLVRPIAPTIQGERVVTAPILRSGHAIFTTRIPPDVCGGGETSWLMELDIVSGGRLGYSVFDVNDDGQFTAADQVPGESGQPADASGAQSSEGMINNPAIFTDGDKEYKFASGSEPNTSATGIWKVPTEKGTLPAGRLSWRQIR